MENIKHKFSFSDQKNLGKETDVPANSERVRLQNSLSTLHQIKGESEILCALYFYLLSTPTQLLWIQNRYVRMNLLG
jgi:hypothetical protein